SSGTDTISARVFNADGSPRTGELTVGSGTTAAPAGINMPVMPKVAMAGNGQFVVAWQNGSSISIQSYNLDGTPATGTIALSSNALDGIATDSVGNFAVLYGGKADRWTAQTVMVQRYKSSGAANANAITVASPQLLNHDAGIAMDGNGNFTVGWDDAVYSRNTGIMTNSVSAQRYTTAGKVNGTLITVAQSGTQTLTFRSLAMNSTGQFVETWSSNYPYAQVYSSAGSPVGRAVAITGSTP